MVDQRIAEPDPQLRVAGIARAPHSGECRPRPRSCRRAPALPTCAASARPGEIAEEGVARVGQREGAAALGRCARRAGKAGPALQRIAGCAEQQRRRASCQHRPAHAEQPQQPRGCSAISSSRIAPAHHAAPLIRSRTSHAPDQQQRERREPQRPCRRLGGRLVADPRCRSARSARRGSRAGFSPAAIRRRTRSRMSPASSASESAIDWPWQTRQRSSSISACACASCRGSGSWRSAQ